MTNRLRARSDLVPKRRLFSILMDGTFEPTSFEPTSFEPAFKIYDSGEGIVISLTYGRKTTMICSTVLQRLVTENVCRKTKNGSCAGIDKLPGNVYFVRFSFCQCLFIVV